MGTLPATRIAPRRGFLGETCLPGTLQQVHYVCRRLESKEVLAIPYHQKWRLTGTSLKGTKGLPPPPAPERQVAGWLEAKSQVSANLPGAGAGHCPSADRGRGSSGRGAKEVCIAWLFKLRPRNKHQVLGRIVW